MFSLYITNIRAHVHVCTLLSLAHIKNFNVCKYIINKYTHMYHISSYIHVNKLLCTYVYIYVCIYLYKTVRAYACLYLQVILYV